MFLAEQENPPISRSQVRRSIDTGEIDVNNVAMKAGYSLRLGDTIRWTWQPPIEIDLIAEDIPLEILYEDDHVAVVNKPAGMVVHPAPGHHTGTLVNAILHHFDELPVIGNALRPGIVHRLDKDTSGAMAVTKSDAGHQQMSALFKDHTIERAYHALAFAPGLSDSGTFESLHGRDPNNRFRYSSRVREGRHAITHYTVLERYQGGAALIECRLETGRTHQIRMHLSEANSPILSDPIYGGKAGNECKLIHRLALHARTLGFNNVDGEAVFCEAPYPEDFNNALEMLRAGKSWR